ncbi:MAG: signal peptidase I [Chloroflexi bacterium]|nr:signal peptidase I [Chloroflexota bacterium]
MTGSEEREEGGPPEGKRGPEEKYDPFSTVWYDPTYPPRFQYLNVQENPQEPEPAREQAPPAPREPEPARAGLFSRPAAPEQTPWEEYRQLSEASAAGYQAARRSRWAVTVREIIETLLLALLIFLAVRASLQNFRVEGASMMPGLHTGQYLIVNKLAYATIDLGMFDWVPLFDPGEDSVHHLFSSPARGDVIVFRAPQSPERDFIKRVIGVPDDVVHIEPDEGIVYVNDKPLEEPYALGGTTCSGGTVSCGPWTVPDDYYFVLGDNRQNSSDSRAFGFVPGENIIGKALISYWPLEDAGLAPNHSVSFAKSARAEE